MYLVKNSYGISAVIAPKVTNFKRMGTLAGSSLDRKKISKKQVSLKKQTKPLPSEPAKFRCISSRTKSKIRKKIIAFAQVEKNLSLLTLTFVNEVTDKIAIKILHKFLDNCVKRFEDFQYLWVAEKQNKNKSFLKNIHFHIINNKYWRIEKWWKYWIDLQAKFGIVPRDESFKPSSAFDVRPIKANNVKAIGNYLTKYVTKNNSQFDCQVWNCSKKISRLYTDSYTGMEFINEFQRLQDAGQLGGEIKMIPKEYCNINLIPLNRTTMKFYGNIDNTNKLLWNNPVPKDDLITSLGISVTDAPIVLKT